MGQRFSMNAVAADMAGARAGRVASHDRAGRRAVPGGHTAVQAVALVAARAAAAAPLPAEDDGASPGWDALLEAVSGVYGSPAPLHHVPTPLAQRTAVGGPSPLEGISVYAAADHWHLVSCGLSDLHGHGGRGFEVTFRVAFPPELLSAIAHAAAAAGEPAAKRRRREVDGNGGAVAPPATHEASSGSESESDDDDGEFVAPRPPAWALAVVDQVARHVQRTGHDLRAGQLLHLNASSRGGLCSLGVVRDPQLSGRCDTLDFLQLVGLHGDESEACYEWSPAEFLEELKAEHGPLLVTRLDRDSAMSCDAFQQRVRDMALRHGSSVGAWPLAAGSGVALAEDGAAATVRLGRADARRVCTALERRLPHGRKFSLVGQSGTAVRIVPAGDAAAQATDAESAQEAAVAAGVSCAEWACRQADGAAPSLTLKLNNAAASVLARSIKQAVSKPGRAALSWAELPGLSVVVC